MRGHTVVGTCIYCKHIFTPIITGNGLRGIYLLKMRYIKVLKTLISYLYIKFIPYIFIYSSPTEMSHL